MLCSEHGGENLILTTASCEGLALESGIQLQQALGRKQQTKLRHCVQQS